MHEAAQAAGAAIEAAGVSFGYRTPLFEALDLRLQPGECVVLLGANGAGKSTLLRLLGGLLVPRAGRVLVDGRPAASLAPAVRCRTFGYLPQRTPRAAGFDVYEIVLMGLYGLLPARGWESRREWSAVARALRRVGASHLLRRRFGELSGGEQRRVLLARALVARPRALLLDEPLAALDPGFALEFTDTLARVHAEGVTLLIATHDLAVARALADRVVMLRDGSLLAAGPPEQLLVPEWLDRLYGTHRFSLAGGALAEPTRGRPAAGVP